MTAPIKIHQFHFSASAADAVTNHMLLIRSALKEAGISGEIFSGETKAPESYRIQKYDPAKLWNCDLLLVHHSHGNPLLESILALEIPRALIYHNITPPEFFRHDPYLEKFSEVGRAQLPSFAGHVATSFGVSRFNCSELESIGLPSPEVFPLLDLSANLPSPSGPVVSRANGKRSLLFVGKLTPHKNQELLIETLFYLQKNFPGRYELQLVGRQDPVYGEYLRLMAKSLRLEKLIHFRGALTPTALEATYARADAFVSPSLHEGFGVPLLEAMQRWLPVFAVPVSGVKETLGKAGVRLVTRMPHKIAEIIDTTLSDSQAVQSLIEAQETRISELTKIHNKERIVSLCMAVVDKQRHIGPLARSPEIDT